MAYDPKELDEALYAVAKLLNSGKASLDGDGHLTFSDAFNFIDDVIPVWNGISGAQLALTNIGDMTPEQKEISKQKFLSELNFDLKDESAFDKVLNCLYSILEVLKAFGVVSVSGVAP